ncbi:kinase-like protein, partial [Exidia glandulosa HHB12029]
MGATVFAAKRYYSLGSQRPVTRVENYEQVKLELGRVASAGEYTRMFNELVGSNPHMQYAKATVYKVVEPHLEEATQAWLVDALLPTTTIRKFSSNVTAGANKDDLGMLCDALAHFVCATSAQHVVLVDIQGISPLILIDPIFHTYVEIHALHTTLSYSVSRHDATAGLGDHGPDGIIQFIEQHVCNRVCKGLKLPLLDVDDVPTKPGKTDNATDGEPDEEEEL